MITRARPSTLEIDQLKIVQLQETARYWCTKVLEGTCTGLAVVGPGGLGKTFTIERLLDDEGIDYAELGRNSHITPLELYRTLYKHREERILLLDDIEHIYKQEVSVAILRSALWGRKVPNAPRRRIVTYSTSREIDVPQSFEYGGGIVLIGNKIPKREDPIVEALLTRIAEVEFSVEPSDVYDFMRQVMVTPDGYAIYDGKRRTDVEVPREDCFKVIDELEARGVTDLRKLEHALIAWRDFKGEPERLKRELDSIARSRGAARSSHSRSPPGDDRVGRGWVRARGEGQGLLHEDEEALDKPAPGLPTPAVVSTSRQTLVPVKFPVRAVDDTDTIPP